MQKNYFYFKLFLCFDSKYEKIHNLHNKIGKTNTF